MLSKPSAVKSEKPEHWTKKASKTLKLFESFLKHHNLNDEWEKFQTSSASQSSTASSGASGGSNPDPEHPDDFDKGQGSGGDDEEDEPEDFDPDDEDFTLFSQKFITVFARLHFNDYRTYTIIVNSNWKLATLETFLCAKLKMPRGLFNFTNTRGANLYKAMSFQSNGIRDNGSIHVLLGIDGGAGKKVIKHQMKEGEAKVRFIAKSKETVKPFLEDFEVKSNITPAEVMPLVQPLLTKVAEIKRRVGQGEDAFVDGLMNLTDEQLSSLETIFSIKKGKFTEQKLVQASYAIVAEMGQLDEFIGHLTKQKNTAICEFIECYASAFAHLRSGDFQFNNDRFYDAVKNTIQYRKGLRRASEVGNVQSEGEQDSASRCDVM